MPAKRKSPKVGAYNDIILNEDTSLMYGTKEKELTLTFVAVRMIVAFVLVPFLSLLWNRQSYVDTSEMGWDAQLFNTLSVFDATQFKILAEYKRTQGGAVGYSFEKNHAFFPLFPYIVQNICTVVGTIDAIDAVAFVLQFVMSWLNTILIYKVGLKVLSVRVPTEDRYAKNVTRLTDVAICEVAAYLYIISHQMLIQISFYSENLFLLLSLLGLYLIYSGEQDCEGEENFSDSEKDQNKYYKYYLPPSHRLVCALFLFALATLTRSTGLLLAFFFAYYMINKTLHRATQCCNIFKFILYSYIGIIVMLLPLAVVIFWKPYMIHCDTKLDRTDQVPAWCLDAMPNVYSFIQFTYWDVQPFGIFYRQPEQALVSIPLFIIGGYFMYRVFAEQPVGFFTLGVFSQFDNRTIDRSSFFARVNILPHAWYFFGQIMLVMALANADINSRVASTIPFYYWAAAATIVQSGESRETISDQIKAGSYKDYAKVSWIAIFIVVHNLGYLIGNLFLFPTEIGFL